MIEVYRNVKTGDLYTVLSFEVVDATNGPTNGRDMVAYESHDGQVYVRETEEFRERFVKIEQ